MDHGDGSRPGTFSNTAAGVPAFIGVKYDGRFPLFWIWHQDIGSAYFNAKVTASAYFRIELYRLVRCGRIGHHIDFDTHVIISPF
jgi:hypothetical protein